MSFSWSTHQLTEFFSAVSSRAGEAEATLLAVELAAEALEAEVSAVTVAGELVAAHGLGAAPPPAALAGAVGGDETVELPGVGDVHLTSAPLGEGTPGTLHVGRADEPFSTEERQMLRGMAQVLGLSLRSIRTLEAERALRQEREREAAERLELLGELRTRERLLETLLAIQRAIFTRRPLQEVLDAITRSASAVMDGAGVALLLKDRDEDRAGGTDGRDGGVDGSRDGGVDGGRDGGVDWGRDGGGVDGGGAAASGPGLTTASTCDLPAGVGAHHRSVAAEAVAADRVSGDASGRVLAVPVHVSGDAAGGLVVEVAAGSAFGGRSAADRQELLAAFAQQVSLALTDARTVAAAHEAHHDSVTGLPNRALFLDRLEHASRVGRRRGTGITVLFIDLDRFKAVNDSLGHAAGDQLLAAVAERIRHQLRASDTVGRLGGDEFAVLLEDVPTDLAVRRAEDVIRVLNEPFRVSGQAVSISGSIGVATSSAADLPPRELLGQADVAMYCAKKGGAGRVVVFEPHMHADVVERLELATDLQHAIVEGGLSVVYQPLVDLRGGRRVGAEALLRWHHPQRGAVSPGVFIPLAEETGMITELGHVVLREAAGQLARWRRTLPDLGMNVNVSARQVMDVGFAADVADVLAATGLPASALTLELTESVLAGGLEVALGQLWALKRAGVRLSVDDFGTGYSSLSYLRKLPVDQLKIDRSFVSGLESGGGDLAVVRAILELSDSLGLEVVAEGIENEEQAAVLRDLGCGLGQGYWLCRPQAPEQAFAYLAAPQERRESA